jgi:hypothetical protein
MPVWSPDGESLAIISERDNQGKVISILDWGAPAQALYVISRDGCTDPQILDSVVKQLYGSRKGLTYDQETSHL